MTSLSRPPTPTDSYGCRLWLKAALAWARARRMLGRVRGNARNLRRYNSHVRESNRLMRRLQRRGVLAAPLPVDRD